MHTWYRCRSMTSLVIMVATITMTLIIVRQGCDDDADDDDGDDDGGSAPGGRGAGGISDHTSLRQI